MRYLLLIALFASLAAPCSGEPLIVYRLGQDHPGWAAIKEYFDSRGYPVTIYQGETTIEKHLERASRINRGPAGIFLAIEFATGQQPKAMVVAPAFEKRDEGAAQPQAGVDAAQPKSGGQPDGQGVIFYAIDEVPARHAEASKRLADSIASSFNVKVRRMPLFPVLGVNMPGIFVHLECKEEQVKELLNTLLGGIDKYTRRDIRR